MTKKHGDIPTDVELQLLNKMKAFNEKYLCKDTYKYALVMRKKYIYLEFHCNNYGSVQIEKVGRLTYTGNIKEMDFAIYKYSTEKYDPNEIFFPGTKHLNGTIEGAMKAGISAYK